MNVHRVERKIGSQTMILEAGKIARQAHGAVVVTYGQTMVLVTAVAAPAREETDYFPLSVDYREKLSAAGRFPGGFMKREGRPSTKEVLTSRMIDRPIRPLFPDGYFEEVQVLATVISADQDHDPDVLAMVGASAALCISQIPFQGPLGACRLSIVDGQYVVNPTYTEREKSEFNLVLGGRKDAINMIEVDARQVSEEQAAKAIAEAHNVVGETCELINDLVKLCGKEKIVVINNIDGQIAADVRSKITDPLRMAYQITSKQERNLRIEEIFNGVKKEYCEAVNGNEPRCSSLMMGRILHDIQRDIVRELILNGKRPDGRGYDELRPVSCEVGLLPRAHGSALFTRGETQALVMVTLGTGEDEQIVDGLLEEYGQKFMLHYNFPPAAVGEVKPIRGPGRREIGHGALAEKALDKVRPDVDKFAYTIKIVSDITESNGSSSMASVCGGSLALFDAGVPMEKAVAGISIGMVSENNKTVLLTDIIGDEDHFGDMDFKIAGTDKGITAIQLDIKAEGLPHDVMCRAFEKARIARMKLLDIMNGTIAEPRKELSRYAPKLDSIKIDPELIGKIIGPSGKMIKSIQEQTGTTIEIEDDGTVYISCVGGDGHLAAKEIIRSMTEPPVVGRIYPKAKVVSVKEFGAFVEFIPGVEGLCHISELSKEYVRNVDEVVKMGDIIEVKLLSIDDQGRFKLSRKAALTDIARQQKQPDKS